jgi:hypothetical protein
LSPFPAHLRATPEATPSLPFTLPLLSSSSSSSSSSSIAFLLPSAFFVPSLSSSSLLWEDLRLLRLGLPCRVRVTGLGQSERVNQMKDTLQQWIKLSLSPHHSFNALVRLFPPPPLPLPPPTYQNRQTTSSFAVAQLTCHTTHLALKRSSGSGVHEGGHEGVP